MQLFQLRLCGLEPFLWTADVLVLRVSEVTDESVEGLSSTGLVTLFHQDLTLDQESDAHAVESRVVVRVLGRGVVRERRRYGTTGLSYVADLDCKAEAQYLHELAQGLGISRQMTSDLEANQLTMQAMLLCCINKLDGFDDTRVVFNQH